MKKCSLWLSFLVMAITMLLFSGCGVVKQTTITVDKTYELTDEIQEIDDKLTALIEQLGPYSQNQFTVWEVQAIQREVRIILNLPATVNGDGTMKYSSFFNTSKLSELRTRALAAYRVLDHEIDSRWSELPDEFKQQFWELDEDLHDFDESLVYMLESGDAIDMVKFMRGVLDVGYCAARLYGTYEKYKE